MAIRFIIIFLILNTSIHTLEAQENVPRKLVVTGIVTDSDNNPIKGAHIYIDSVRTRIKTNKKGYYRIKLSSNNKLLSVFSRNHGLLNNNYSMQPEVNFVYPKNHHEITEEELEQMGYIVSVQKGVKKDQEYDLYTDIYQLIRDKFPSVQVSGKKITIRGGTSTMLGSNTPLFVINGAVVSSISSISPADIESIEILKGTNTALYGARGANGVIKIKLK